MIPKKIWHRRIVPMFFVILCGVMAIYEAWVVINPNSTLQQSTVAIGLFLLNGLAVHLNLKAYTRWLEYEEKYEKDKRLVF